MQIPAVVRAYLERTFERCEQIRRIGFCVRELPILVNIHRSFNILQNYTILPPELGTGHTLC